MAATIRLVTFSGQTVTPKNDAIVYDASIGRCGVFYGCDVTASGNIVYVSSGYGMVRGRFFEIEASTLSVTLASTDTLQGRLYIRMDLSNTESPIQLLTYTGSSLPALEQDADANFVDGVWEMEMATFTVTTTEVTDVVETYETITDNGTLINALQAKTTAALKIISYSANYTVNGSQGKNLNANDFGMSTPSGYRPVAITRFSSGNANVYVRGVTITATGTDGVLYMNNTTSSSVSATAYIQILYAQTGLM